MRCSLVFFHTIEGASAGATIDVFMKVKTKHGITKAKHRRYFPKVFLSLFTVTLHLCLTKGKRSRTEIAKKRICSGMIVPIVGLPTGHTTPLQEPKRHNFRILFMGFTFRNKPG
jgi:hypothetical protein